MTVPTEAPTFRSFGELRLHHAELLSEHDRHGDSDEFLSSVEAFIASARAMGILIEQPSERRSAQSVLDYWTATLYAAGRSPALTILAPYEPAVVQHPLSDADLPYPGLAAFTTADQHRFFGRELLVTEIISRLRSKPLISVTGPAASGKTSLVQAGGIPALQIGRLEGSNTWHYFPTVTPGPNPLRSLARLFLPSDVTDEDEWLQREIQEFSRDSSRLATLVSEFGPSVLFIDQFETAFGADAFVSNVAALANHYGSGCLLIVAARSEEGFASEQLAALFSDETRVEIPAPGVRELRDAVAQPAALVGLKFDHGVVADLVGSLVGAPAALLLLQFVLEHLWTLRERDKNLITESAYRNFMWDRKRHRPNALAALAGAAQRALDTFSSPEKIAARDLTLRLVAPGEGWDLRLNRLRRSQLVGGASEDPLAAHTLVAFTECGVVRVTADGAELNPNIELTHPGLSRYWSTLGQWLDEAQAAQRQRRRVLEAAEFWRDHSRDTGALLRGATLEDAAQFRRDPDPLLSTFIEASLAADRQRRLTRTGAVVGIAALLLVVAALAVLVAWQQYTFERESFSRRLAAQAQLVAPENLDLSLLLALNAFRMSPGNDAHDTLINALEGNPRLTTLLGADSPPTSVSYSADGSSVAIGENNGTIKVHALSPSGYDALFDAGDAGGAVDHVAFAPDGRHLVSTSSNTKVVDVWDLQTRDRFQIAVPGPNVTSIAIAPGNVLAFTTADTVVVWDLGSGGELWREPAMSSGQAPALDAKTPLFVRTSVAFSQDGHTLAVAECRRSPASGCAARVQLFDAATGTPGEARETPGGAIAGVQFGGNDSDLLASTADGRVMVWRHGAQGWDLLDRAVVSRQNVDAHLVVSGDGRLVAFGDCLAVDLQGHCIQNGVRLWNLDNEQRLPPLPAHASSIVGLAFDARGSSLVMASPDGAKVWNLDGRKATSDDVLSVPNDRVMARSAQGEYRAANAACPQSRDVPQIRCQATSIRIWNASATVSGEALERSPQAGEIRALVLDPAGKLLAVATTSGNVELWDLDSRTLRWSSARHQGAVRDLAFGVVDNSPVVASVGADKRLLLSKVSDGSVLRWIDTGAALVSVAVSTDGIVGGGDASGQLYVWTAQGAPLHIAPLVGSQGVQSLAFGQSHEGATSRRLIASADRSGAVRVWNAETGRLLASPPLAAPQGSGGLEFNVPAYGEPLTLTSHSVDRDTTWQFDFDPGRYADRVCSLVDRSMRHGQETQYLRRDLQFPSNLLDRFFGPPPAPCSDVDGGMHT